MGQSLHRSRVVIAPRGRERVLHVLRLWWKWWQSFVCIQAEQDSSGQSTYPQPAMDNGWTLGERLPDAWGPIVSALSQM
jgi:hypothetical protein